MSIRWRPVNQAPTAVFNANPTSGDAPLLVNFDGFDSFDPDGTIVSYAWNFGDGNNGTGVSTSHTYSTPGTYTATLTVTDNQGATSSTTEQITVTSPANQLPVASFTATPTSGDAPLTVSFDASGSSDSDGTIFSYAWNFGDGSSGSGETTSNTFGTPGTYIVSLIVTDDDGATDIETATIVVNDPSGEDCTDPINLAVNVLPVNLACMEMVNLQFANDGNTVGDSPNGASANLQHTADGEPEPWWEVDLGQQSDIQSITIYNRTTTIAFLERRLNNFYVFISSQPFSGSLDDIIANGNVEQFFFSGNAGAVEAIPLGGVGRYVRVQKAGVGPLHMAEVQVFGCPVANNLLISAPTQRQEEVNTRDISSEGHLDPIDKDLSGFKVTEQEMPSMTAAPNPFNRNFILTVKGQVSDRARIRILDVLGQTVYDNPINGRAQLELGNQLSSGTYWIQLIDGKTFNKYKSDKVRKIKN